METRELLKQEIATTSQSLQNKVDKLEEVALEKVENVAEGVRKTAETIQEGVQSLSLQHQMEVRPGAVIAASVGAGALLGLRLTRKHTVRGMAMGAARTSIGRMILGGVLSQAASMLVPVVLGVGAGIVGDWAKRKYPNATDTIDKLQNALGGSRQA